MSAASVAGMAGRLLVVPGAALPHSLSSSRQDWASRLSAGQPTRALPGLMASLFSLCGNAHRACAQLAIDAATAAASGGSCGIGADDLAERLRMETVQEHIRRIGLDWPRLLAVPSAIATAAASATASLSTCPALRPQGTHLWAAMLDWLRNAWLYMDPAAWLAGWLSGAGDWLHRWSLGQSGWLPSLLQGARTADTPQQPLGAAHALRAHASHEGLRALSRALDREPHFTQRPEWQQQVAHTGTWARLLTPVHQPALSPWAMLGSRLAELVRLCLPTADSGHGARWMRWGALEAQPGQGVGWVEMARGLLVHQVSLEGDGVTTMQCRVLAPTEWNFHPRGEVAQRLSALDPRSPAVTDQVRLLMAAFDPCVPFEIGTQDPQEARHA